MKKRMFMALALSATLAMGAVPAFAEDTTPTGSATDPTATKDNKGNTVVSVQTLATNIKATIPLNVTVVGPADGGALTGVPNNYQIENGSVYPIKVSAVQAVEDETIKGWGLATGPLTTASTSTNTIGDLYLTLTPENGTLWIASKTENKPSDWYIGPKTDAGDTANKITLAGSVSQIKTVSDTAVPAVKLQFTIAPTTLPEPAPTPTIG